jgi:serine/threonine protein kinase
MSNLIGQSFGRYHILEQLGEGGMAVVYKAFDTRLERNVAIKVILPSREQNEKFLKRFEREARALAQQSHPNIVKVLDYGDHDGVPYLVMEYIPGGTLKQKLGKPIAWQEAARLLAPIARALEYAHQQKIIHRDVKPANILLTQSGEPMLSDFGIAKILEGEETVDLTGTGVGIGTPEYMAPEQGVGQAVDHRADIYALGVVFYEMVTGRKPYQADTPMAVMLKKVTEPLPRPRQFAPDLPDSVESILLIALARSPENRYREMNDFAAALEGLSAGVVEKKKGTGRKSLLIATGISGGLLLLAVICAGTWLVIRANPGPDTAVLSDTPLQPTPTAIPSAIPTESVSNTAISQKDGAKLILIPAGEFTMGSNSYEPYFWGAESPKHTVYLDSFLIYRTEVTNDMYRTCVGEQACPLPDQIYSNTNKSYFNNPQFGNYPVIYVTYYDAIAYCKWANARLPTEAEWEKAARGTDGRLFPWGNTELNSSYANFCDTGCPNTDPNEIEFQFDDGFRDTAPVGSFPAGGSPYGALDMAGNVLEWVYDWMGPYNTSESRNPTGPVSGSRYVVRGGSWYSGRGGLRTSARASYLPDSSFDSLGFRCAVNAP